MIRNGEGGGGEGVAPSYCAGMVVHMSEPRLLFKKTKKLNKRE